MELNNKMARLLLLFLWSSLAYSQSDVVGMDTPDYEDIDVFTTTASPSAAVSGSGSGSGIVAPIIPSTTDPMPTEPPCKFTLGVSTYIYRCTQINTIR